MIHFESRGPLDDPFLHGNCVVECNAACFCRVCTIALGGYVLRPAGALHGRLRSGACHVAAAAALLSHCGRCALRCSHIGRLAPSPSPTVPLRCVVHACPSFEVAQRRCTRTGNSGTSTGAALTQRDERTRTRHSGRATLTACTAPARHTRTAQHTTRDTGRAGRARASAAGRREPNECQPLTCVHVRCVPRYSPLQSPTLSPRSLSAQLQFGSHPVLPPQLDSNPASTGSCNALWCHRVMLSAIEDSARRSR